MTGNKKKIPFASVGIISAIAASLCCITPVLAFIAGVGGLASTFSWIEPIRPYMIALTVLALAFAWYQKIKSSKTIDCDCDADAKGSFWQTKTFLSLVTVFAFIMLFFPYYAKVFYPNGSEKSVIVETQNITSQSFTVMGMTCSACEEHIKQAVNELPGIVSVVVFHKTGKVTVQFDKTKINNNTITAKINSTGYKVKE